jgi:hypothetical protein
MRLPCFITFCALSKTKGMDIIMKRKIYFLIILVFVIGTIYFTYKYTNSYITLNLGLIKDDVISSKYLRDFGYGGTIYKVKSHIIQDNAFNKYILVTEKVLKTTDNTKLLNINLDKGSHLVIETSNSSKEIIKLLNISIDEVMPGYDRIFGDYSVGVSIFKFNNKYYIGNMDVNGISKFSTGYYDSLLQGFLYNKEKFIPGYTDPQQGK